MDVDHAELNHGVVVVDVELQGAFVGVDGLVVVSGLGVDVAEAGEDLGVFGGQFGGAAAEGGGLFIAFGLVVA